MRSDSCNWSFIDCLYKLHIIYYIEFYLQNLALINHDSCDHNFDSDKCETMARLTTENIMIEKFDTVATTKKRMNLNSQGISSSVLSL